MATKKQLDMTITQCSLCERYHLAESYRQVKEKRDWQQIRTGRWFSQERKDK